jgi:putative addiction module killer protein
MFELIQTQEFSEWLASLRDRRAAARVQARLDRAALGNFGDVKWSIAQGVSEMRIDYGPGYRVYFTRQGQILVVLLCGGDKSTQQADIAEAKRLYAAWKEEAI